MIYCELQDRTQTVTFQQCDFYAGPDPHRLRNILNLLSDDRFRSGRFVR
jgi:hypothetical protein